MMIIRPISHDDYPALYDIANASGIGFTSLPVNETLLKNKIQASERAFNHTDATAGEQSYLFVMQDEASKQVVGTSGIQSAVGLEDAFYHYHLGKVVHASRELNIHNTVDILTFCNDYTGVSEICTLFLKEEARQDSNGRVLSKFRFLFMAEHSQRFSDLIIAEMRGVSDEKGRSPFWQWLEEHFFSMDFPTADYLTGIGDKRFIAELMPKYPIYVNLLSTEAQAVIGRVHDKTKPALQLLEKEGFSWRGYVDIFDAGPTVEANLNHILTVRQSRKLKVKIDDGLAAHGQACVAINTQLVDFRGAKVEVYVPTEGDSAIISAQAANALNVEAGDLIRFSPLKSKGSC